MHTLIAGLPGSGKTTFIAALWQLLTEGGVPTNVQLKQLEGSYEHLNRIRDSWLVAEELPRTQLADHQLPDMVLMGFAP